MITSQKYKFEPGAMSIIQMGEELIGHPSTALGELVKNAYDADAINCKIYIHLDKEPQNSFLIVFDDGVGMSSEILFGQWLQPSMSTKRTGNKRSEVFDRPLLGSKGIGRLAAMALGDHLTVISKKIKEKEHNWIKLSRKQFKQETLLRDISFPGGTIKNAIEIFSDEKFLEKQEIKKNEFLVEVLEKEFIRDLKEGTLILIESLDDSVQSILTQKEDNEEISFEETGIFLSLRSLITPLELIISSQEELLKKKIIDNKFIEKESKDKLFLWFGSNLLPRQEKSKQMIDFIPVEPLPITKEFDYRAIGKVDENGNVQGFYSCKRLAEDQPEDYFNLTPEFVHSEESLRKRRGEELEDIPQKVKNAKLGEFYFDIRIYDRDPDVDDKLNRLFNRPGKLVTKRLLNNLLGFRVAKNNFGVKPYGEEDKDWMGLGQIRVQNPSENLTPNQILGYVFLFDNEKQNPNGEEIIGLSEKTNREGFFENKAFINLKEIIRAILIYLGRRRYHYRLKHDLGRVIRNKLKRPDTKAFMNFIETKVTDPAIVKRSETFIKEVTTALDNMEHTLTFSQRLSSMGSGIELVYHELRGPLDQLGGIEYSIDLKTKKVTPEELKKKFLEDIENLAASTNALEALKESLRPAIGLSRKKTFKPIDTFHKVCILFKRDIAVSSIKIKESSSLAEYEIKDYEYALWISFLNIMNNAVYWLKRTDDEKVIKLTLEKGENLVIENSGPKIPEDYLDLIFEYGVTLKQEKSATGLGLSFTRSILNSHGWEISAENRENGPAFLIKRSENQ